MAKRAEYFKREKERKREGEGIRKEGKHLLAICISSSKSSIQLIGLFIYLVISGV